MPSKISDTVCASVARPVPTKAASKSEPGFRPGSLLVCVCTMTDPDAAPIPGSLCRSEFHARLGSIPHRQELVFYCCGCEDDLCSRVVADSFVRRGYPFAWVLRGGAKAWHAKFSASTSASAGTGGPGHSPSRGPAPSPASSRWSRR